MIDLPPPSYEQTIEAIVQCGVPRASVSIKFEQDVQSDEITISDLGEVTDGKLRCLRLAVHPYYLMWIVDDAQRSAFFEFSEREDRPAMLARVNEWLGAKGMLDRVPQYDPERGLVEFSNALERACGLSEGSALTPSGNFGITFKSDYLLNLDPQSYEETFKCLNYLYAASNARDHSIHLFIIGNAASSEGTQD